MVLVDVDKKARLVAGLINKTLENRVRWREGVREGVFVVDFSNSSITLEKAYSGLTGAEYYKMRICNELGDIVDEFDVGNVLFYTGRPKE